jgi:hypothetical protein
MSVNVRKTEKVNWRFNENYTYHHYDLSSCIDANTLRLKLGVIPILTYHNSPGLRSLEDETFCKNQKQFLEEYGKN